MASGSSGRANTGSKGFDFGSSDDILCSYEDYGNQDSSNNGSHSDPTVIGATSNTKDFHKSRMARPSVFPSPVYNQQEDSFSQDVMMAVEKSMKKYADNLMRFLEGISSRLSQLELYCYNLDKSIGEMRNDLTRDNEEADAKLKSVEKHLQEVHRSVQILRDKQELAETQKELAKLQLAQKESSPSGHSQVTEERASPAASDSKKTDNEPEMHNQQLALALPHQVAPQQQPVAPAPAPIQAPPQSQQQAYYLPPTQLPNPSSQTQHPQGQYMASDPQFRSPQMSDPSRVPQPSQFQVTQTPPVQSLPQYQQQWAHQIHQQVPPSQQPSVQPGMRPPSPTVYSPYTPNQAVSAPPPENLQSSMPMQLSYAGVPQADSNRVDAMPYGYSGVGRTVQQPQPQSQPQPQPTPPQMKGPYGGQQSDKYMTAGPQPTLPPGSTYMVYDSEGGRTHVPQAPHYQQGVFPPSNAAPPNMPPGTGPNHMLRNPSPPQFARGHPYGELIDKLVSMGFRGDHAASVIQRMEESGQPVDFNAVLDRLSAHSAGSPQRGW